ncbi:peptidoglycan editing factor PgeF [bacterium]|nr:peptidoglycan editing factor PgeF [bacterium]
MFDDKIAVMAGEDGILLRFPLFEMFEDSIRAAVTTRIGGVSESPYDTLNLGLLSGDKPERVIENRRRALSHFRTGKVDPAYKLSDWAGVMQVHGSKIAFVSRGQNRSEDETQPDSIDTDNARAIFTHGGVPTLEADGMCTSEAGIVLTILVADCVPVVLYDANNHALGVAHCGWQPTAKGVLTNLIATMHERFGTHPRDTFAGIGPGIGGHNYEVGEDVASHFRGEEYEGFRVQWESPKNAEGDETKFHLNLQAALNAQLSNADIPRGHVNTLVRCTFEEREIFFSYRRDGAKTGRMALMAELL